MSYQLATNGVVTESTLAARPKARQIIERFMTDAIHRKAPEAEVVLSNSWCVAGTCTYYTAENQPDYVAENHQHISARADMEGDYMPKHPGGHKPKTPKKPAK